MAYPDRDSYRVVNPDVADNYYTTAGVAIGATTQPKVDGGATVFGNGTDRNLLAVLPLGSTETEIYGSQIVSKTPTSSASGTIPSRTIADMQEGRYIMRRGGANTLFVAGVASNVLRHGSSDYGQRRSINSRLRVRGPLTATAVRLGYWVEFSGAWSTDPTDSTDGLGNVGGDTSADQTIAADGDQAVLPTGLIPGELVFIAGNSNTILQPVQADYKVKTTR